MSSPTDRPHVDPPSPVDLVVFDLGGVLVRIVRSWREAHEGAGLPPHPILDSPAFLAASAEVHRQHQVGTLAFDEWCERVVACSDGAYTVEDAARILDAWSMDEYPGVGGLIEAVHAAGVATAALSNTNPRHWLSLCPEDRVWDRYPSVGRLQSHHASHLMGLMKPDPAIYRALEDATGHRGERILFFDDGEANIEAAQAAGWRAELVDHTGDPAAQMLEALRRHGVC
ncbi:MAG: HAD-IA family hydrolase [Dehalococcoidia bacterium]|nr:HAD-IA family hydrolase [Dehalococcoidia bacterium]